MSDAGNLNAVVYSVLSASGLLYFLLELVMKNKYEERLGTERMLPLVFKMALPAVAAQFVNLLYNIVDRVYIGHIPGIGTDALAGVGVTTSIVILISAFSAIVGAGGSPLAAIALG